MDTAYQPDLWQNLYIALCGASAALTGLLFISTSLHVEEVKIPILRVRAAGTTTQSAMMIIVTAVVLLPQSYKVIGLELKRVLFLCAPAFSRLLAQG
jgi:hypothetical protein